MTDPIAPIKVLATNEMFRDPALADISEAELEDYRKTRDYDAIKDRLQGSPTIFDVKRLPPTAAMTLDTMNEKSRLFTAFLLACHDVTLADGASLVPDPKKMRNAQHGAKLADDQWFNDVATRFGIETCYEVGRVAYEWARLPSSAKGPFTY